MGITATGGPAFPTSSENYERNYSACGMTMRDYLAAKAPITVEDAMLACGNDVHSIGMLAEAKRVVVLAVLATMRGEYADAMLAERDNANGAAA